MARTFDAGGGITLAFTTPVHAEVMSGGRRVNDALRTVILAREHDEPGLQKSNVGGWHSEPDLLKWDCADVRVVLGWFAEVVKRLNDFMLAPEYVSGEMDASAWANVCRRGHYHQPHNHPASDWSGVYYVCTGNDGAAPRPSGCIDLLDPRSGIGSLDTPGRPFIGTLQFAPEPGLMLVFPSWLTHHVHPHAGSGERISIAFNARMVSANEAPRHKGFWRR